MLVSATSCLPRLARMVSVLIPLLICSVLCLPSVAWASEKVVLQLRWQPQFQFAGYIVAKWKGYYSAADLDVEIRSAIKEDGSFFSAIHEVEAGRAQFGIGAADILVARDRGVPLVILATILHQSPAAFYTLAKTKITSLADFTKLKVARRVNDLIDIELQAMLRSEGIDPKNIVSRLQTPSVDNLISGRIDISPGYSITTPYLLESAGVEWSSINPSVYGVDFYGDSLFTTEFMVEFDPETVRRFVKASLKGWKYALEHPEEVASHIASEYPGVNGVVDARAFNIFQSKKVAELTLYPAIKLGYTNPERWSAMHRNLKQCGLVSGMFDPAAFIYDSERVKEKINSQHDAIISAGLVAVFAIILMLFALVVILGRKVKYKSKSLNQEITNHNHTEVARRKSEEQFSNLANDLPALVCTFMPDSTLTYVNKAYSDYFERSSESLIGRKFLDFMPSKDAAEEVRKSYMSLTLEHPHSTHIHQVLRNGNTVWHEWTNRAFFDLDGSLSHFQAVGFDITGRKMAEEALMRSESQYFNLANDMPAMVFTHLPDGTMTFANQLLCEFFNHSRDELIGRTILSFADEMGVEGVEEFYDALTPERPIATQVFQVPYNGAPLWQEWISRAFFDEAGNTTHYQAMGFDITERKLAEEALVKSESQYFNLANDLPAMVCTHLPDSTLTFANELFCKFFNQSRDDLIGQRFLGFLSDMEVNGVEEFYASLSTDQPYSSRIFRVPRNGDELWHEWTSRAFFNEEGVATHYQAVGFDITERKEIHDQLVESNLRLSQLTENIEDVFWLIGIDDVNGYQILYASPAFEGIWQHSVKELYEEPSLWLGPIYKEDKERVGRAFEVFLAGQDDFDEEYRIVRPDGTMRVINDKGFHIYKDREHRVAGIARDITDKKLLERKVVQKSKMESIGHLAGGIAHEINTPAQFIQNNTLFFQKYFNIQTQLLQDYEKLRDATASEPSLTGIHDSLQERYESDQLDYLASEVPEAIEQSLTGLERIKTIVKAVMSFAQPYSSEREHVDLNKLIETCVTVATNEWSPHSEVRMDLDNDLPPVWCAPDLINQSILNLLINSSQSNAEKVSMRNLDKALIDIATEVDGNEVVIAIADQGMGIPESVRDKVFDLFFSTRDVGMGRGEGLALVYRSIVDEHDGSIDFETEVGKGTTFFVRLPL